MRGSLTHSRDLLFAYVKPQSVQVAALAALLLGSTGLQLVTPQLLRTFIDAATSGGVAEYLTGIAVLFIGLALAQQALAVAATYFSEHVGWTATNALRADLTLHCLKLDLAFHKSRTPGELIERLDGDVTALANFFSQFVVQLLGNMLLLLGVLVLLWSEEWRIGLVLTAFSLATLAAMNSIRGIAVPYWTAARQASADLFGFIEERLAGTVDIRSSGAAAYVIRRLYDYTRERFRTGTKARLVSSFQWGTPIVLFSVGLAATFVVSAYLFWQGAITLGTVFLIYSYANLSFRPLRIISNQLEEFQRASAGIVRIQELLQTRSVLVDGPGATLPAGALSVEFECVSFGYGDEEMVLRDLSFRLEPATVLGLLGRTGSGKTTIARLLFRLYDPENGTIRLGGVDLRTARRAEVRERVGMVTQDVQLFRATVRENVTFFDPAIDDERIMQALADLGLADWCRSLPHGLDTMLAAGGGGLSAGEAQLLAFTRVFLKDPGLVILDEASSRLDPVTERLIERAIDKLLVGRTSIIIAHRLTTVQRADAIMILEDGEICEYGARDKLVADPASRFSRLLQSGLEQVLA